MNRHGEHSFRGGRQCHVSGPLLARLLRPIEIMRRVDQRDVGKGLGKIAQQPFAGGIATFFREQAKIVAQRKKA
jgi:hypothetical protein